MIYAGIDVNIITHEKAEAAGPEAFGLWCWGMCWAQVHESDGRLPRILVLRALSGRRNVMLAKRLVAVGLWSVEDDGGWTIWNYASKNQTREQIQAKKDAAKKRKEEWKARQSGDWNANGTRSGNASEHGPEHPLPPPSQSQPPPPPPPPKEETIGTATPSAEPVTKVSRRKPETGCPDSSASSDAVSQWALGWKIPILHADFEHFLDHHRKSEARWRDWAAAWRTWLRNGPRFGGRGSAPRQPIGAAANAAWMNPTKNFDFGAGK